MCLILFAHHARPDLPFVLAANRDEFHGRPTATADYWHGHHPHVLAGRDLQDGGTWLGVHRSGRFAAVTNFSEEPPLPSTALRSRGELPLSFLSGGQSADSYLEDLAQNAFEYRGFNLLIGDGTSLHYYSNRTGEPPQSLAPGVYGLSNQRLDCDWPKVRSGRSRLAQLFDAPDLHEALFDLLADQRVPPDSELPQRGRDIELERRVAPSFIVNETYGTRACTVLVARRQPGNAHAQLEFRERSFAPLGKFTEERRFELLWGGE